MTYPKDLTTEEEKKAFLEECYKYGTKVIKERLCVSGTTVRSWRRRFEKELRELKKDVSDVSIPIQTAKSTFSAPAFMSRKPDLTHPIKDIVTVDIAVGDKIECSIDGETYHVDCITTVESGCEIKLSLLPHKFRYEKTINDKAFNRYYKKHINGRKRTRGI